MKVFEVLNEKYTNVDNMMQAIDLLESKCSDTFKAFISSKGDDVLYRGDQIASDIVWGNVRERSRSLGGFTALMHLTSVLPSWKGIPPRNASYLATADKEHADEFGNRLVVFPQNGPVGFTHYDDFNDFRRGGDTRDLTILANTLESVMTLLADHGNRIFGSGTFIRGRVVDNINKLKELHQSKDSRKVGGMLQDLMDNIYNEKEGGLLIDALGDMDPFKKLDKLFDPFQFDTEATTTSDPKIFAGTEVWFQQGLFMTPEMAEKILRIVS